ncbi:MAG: efflux RND transporter periplasmic adaptor subunit [Melioribacteraceae bacterium]|nr:efflux RND transporter periplasmic adaptor subunit [Melioribacteraceae bacterium]
MIKTNFKKVYAAFVILAVTLFIGCSHEHEHDSNNAEHEHSSISITQYTDSTEIFMEYPALVINTEAKFLIHLTDLKNFKAVTEGVLTVEFINQKGTKFSIIQAEPTRAGIYTPVVEFIKPGKYKMTITLTGKQVSDIIIVNNLIVYSNESEIPHEEEESSSSISFLKEQQWKIDFKNEPVIKRKMEKSVVATGEIKAKSALFSKVVSPIEGVVLSKNNESLKPIGSFVKKGDVLLNISPSADASFSIQKIKNDFHLAESEYERAQNLFNKKAVSRKRLEEAKFDFEAKQASYNSLIDQIKITENGFAIIAPISGHIENKEFVLGDHILSGQELFTIINPHRLVLKANVPSSQFEAANNSTDASFNVEGINSEFRISNMDGKKISVAASLNETNRTVPVYFEFSNPKNKIKVGMYAEVYIKVGGTNEYISIPESAIVNEDGLHTAYVQTEGEVFEKRILKTGIINNGYVQIISGLKVGEMVVTVGAYQVRLAALSPESAIGHGHAH